MNNPQTLGSPVVNGSKVLAIGAASASVDMTNPDQVNTIRIVATVNCFVEIGANPTASPTTSMFILANTPECFSVPQAYMRTNYQVAVIQATGVGSLYITPMA